MTHPKVTPVKLTEIRTRLERLAIMNHVIENHEYATAIEEALQKHPDPRDALTDLMSKWHLGRRIQ